MYVWIRFCCVLSAYRSDGADGLLHHHRRLRLAQGRHLGDDVGHDGARHDERRDGGHHDEGEQPSLREGDDELKLPKKVATSWMNS